MRSRRGAHALEFALILPVIVAILGGIAEYGFVYSQQIWVVGVARDAARSAAATPQDWEPDPLQVAEQSVLSKLEAEQYNGTVYLDTRFEGTSPDQLVVVEVAIPYQPIFGLVPTPERYGSSVVMRMQDQLDTSEGSAGS